MALQVTESQNTKVYLIPAGTALTDAASIETAITSGKQIGCLQDLGSIAVSRNVQEYSCLSSDETAKSLGAISLPNITMQLLFDADDVTGQAELRSMWNDNSRRIMVVELPDQITPTTGNPTYIYFEAGLSSHGVTISKDNAVMVDVTVEICSNPKYVYAS